MLFYFGDSPPPLMEDDPSAPPVYGSEIAMHRIAQQAIRHGWKVYIFGNRLNKDYEHTPSGILYYPSQKYPVILEQIAKVRPDDPIPDVLIVSRYIHFFIEHEIRAKRVYYWMHDLDFHTGWPSRGILLPSLGKPLMLNVLPQINQIVTVSIWHKEFMQNLYHFPDDKIRVITNGIDSYSSSSSPSPTTNKNGDTEKKAENQVAMKRVRNRFIWTSRPDRGLLPCILFLEKLAEYNRSNPLYANITLDIYRDKSEFQIIPGLEDALKRNAKFVNAFGYVDHERLSKEFRSADVWFYPTDFDETDCMSAKEAQFGGCIVICTKKSGLLHSMDASRGFYLDKKPVYGQEYNTQTFETLHRVISMTEAEKEEKRRVAQEWAATQTWDNIFTQHWLPMIEESSKTQITTGASPTPTETRLPFGMPQEKRKEEEKKVQEKQEDNVVPFPNL